MRAISVVIITKNEAHIIGETIRSLTGLTDDIVIADTGSIDNTISIARSLGCKVSSLSWEGFGKTKNRALDLAVYDWILFLDADELVDPPLLKFLKDFPLNDIRKAYKIRFKNFIGKKPVRYGEWAHEKKLKIFHRSMGRWDNAEIHEKIAVQPGVEVGIADGYIHHFLFASLQEYAEKMNRYAELVAHKYHQQGKSAGWFKLYLYPCFQFLSNYLFKLGFLDGRLGFITSFFSSYYSFLKYHRLEELNQGTMQ